MARRFIGKAMLSMVWQPVVFVVVVGLAAVSIVKVREIFTPPQYVQGANGIDESKPFTKKTVTYELFGSGSGTISFMNVENKPVTAKFTSLPWSNTETTTLTSVSANIMAQTSGGQIRCRITVNGQVRDEQANSHAAAAVTCNVKSA